MVNLRKLGFATYTALDHDGIYDGFMKQIISYAKADPAMDNSGVPITEYGFDKSPIYDDLATLEKWRNQREQSGAQRAALYFNAITLHAGSHEAGRKEWWRIDRATQYKTSLERLLTEFQKFLEELSSSGRNTLVVFIPEHGMALRASSIQAPDLREIPLPAITRVPVGIKFIGKGFPLMPAKQEIISKPSSYLALSYLVSVILKDFIVPDDKTLASVPETPYVAENQENRIVRIDTDYFLNRKEGKWIKIPPTAFTTHK